MHHRPLTIIRSSRSKVKSGSHIGVSQKSLFDPEVVRKAILPICETEAAYISQLKLSPEEKIELHETKHPQKRLQWLAARFALHQLVGTSSRIPLTKDAHGKPFFQKTSNPESGLFCSISHSDQVVAAMVSPLPCGCDIQKMDERTLKLAPRYLNPTELATITNLSSIEEQLFRANAYWSAKESLYKFFGKGALDTRNQVRVFLTENPSILFGSIETADFCETVQIFVREEHIPGISGRYIFTWCTSSSVAQ